MDRTNKCQIRWIDTFGHHTADNNPSIGRVRTKERYETHHGRTIKFEQSAWFNICACHAERLHDHGMHIWEFEAIEA